MQKPLLSHMIDSPRRVVGAVCRRVVTLAAAYPVSRGILNRAYRRFGTKARLKFHGRYAQAFRNTWLQGRPGEWIVDFNGHKIRMPLTRESFPLDWETAVSIVGHDLEVKETYASLLGGPLAPELFIDAGANYGTHSLLFLATGVETLAFEPNASCHAHFFAACKLNGLKPAMLPFALGAERGSVNLSYPQEATWLGSTRAAVVDSLAATHSLVTRTVKLRMLDDFLEQARGKRVLLKIDTEGDELAVLEGARQMLAEVQPLIIFECWNAADRTKIFGHFANSGYRLAALPWAHGAGTEMNLNDFQASKATNFIAVPVHSRNP